MDERRVEEAERLARVEEQVKGMREDFGEFKEFMTSTVTTFMGTISGMHKEYLPRSESEKELALRDNKIQHLEHRMDKLEGGHKDLTARPTWHSILIIGVVGAGVGSLVLAFFELLMRTKTGG